MTDLGALYRQFDPFPPLRADEANRYVDWQRRLRGTEDVKHRLAKAITFGANQRIVRLFTGHRGGGKTTELYRVKQQLETASDRRIFVSMLVASGWLNLQDVHAEDLIFETVRQLVDDLRKIGYEAGPQKLQTFWQSVRQILSRRINLDEIEIGTDPLTFSFSLTDLPTARDDLRKVLEGQAPRFYDLVNDEILDDARQWLAKPENGGYEDILMIIDDLDKMSYKALEGTDGLTNQVVLFLYEGEALSSLDCDILYTVPIELAYSRWQVPLTMQYGGPILSLPLITVRDSAEIACSSGVESMEDIVARRTTVAGVKIDDLFESRTLLDEVLLMTGGHVRSLFVLLRSMLERIDNLPITQQIVQQCFDSARRDAAKALRPRERSILREVQLTKSAPEDEGSFDDFRLLLRDLYVLYYEDERESWYDVNPLLKE